MNPEPHSSPDTLAAHLAAARQQPPALALEEVRHLVATAPAPLPPPSVWTRIARQFNPFYTMASLLITVTTALLLTLPTSKTPSADKGGSPKGGRLHHSTLSAGIDTTAAAARQAAATRKYAAEAAARQKELVAGKGHSTLMESGDSLRYFKLPPGQTLVVPLSDANGHPAGRYFFHGPDTLAAKAARTSAAAQLPLSTLSPDTATLRRLGLRLTATGIYYRHRIQGGGLLDLAYENGQLLFGHNPLPNTAAPTAIFPIFITSANGRELLRYQLPSESSRKSEPAYFTEILDRLTPIAVHVPNTTGPDHQVIFWFEVTPALLAILPHPTASEVWCTYRPYLPPATLATPAMRPCVAPKDSPVPTPTWSVYPNPAHDTFQLELSVAPSQQLTVRLLDITGHTLQQFPPTSFSTHDTLKRSFRLDGIPAGLYLVQLDGGSGQHWSRRLVVE